MNFNDLRRDFLSDPNPQNSKSIINLMRRYNFVMPLNSFQVRDFCQNKKDVIMNYVLSMDYGNPSNLACVFYSVFKFGKEWAKKVIENDKTGNSSYYSYLMVPYNCQESREWAESVIDKSEAGNPSFWAYEMVDKHYSDLEWAERVRERQGKRKLKENGR